MTAWPTTLPRPLVETAAMDIDCAHQNAPMQSGLIRQRVKNTANSGAKTIRMVLRQDDARDLFSFLSGLDGAAFDMETTTPADIDGSMSTVSARFLGDFTIGQAVSPTAKEYSFDIQIEAVQPNYLNDAAIFVYLDHSGEWDIYPQLVENMTNAAPSHP